ncbi:hypothetical protein BU26DRAFT_518609 [Trematosphaeria pertusa]|uniref:Uncharacterized protein n=1 Tax=Trematosphaeria pertusa TaxID=390896 RepID=A0A6A6IL04_9PLEO|nr:uncharacterized protein BU26DRAFT_518609 [Trematosphaeria pertusa]KAF2250173.1 hypothetical protein BU26DRAFT_518609 [Trematosphaeria pertusa]
MPDQTPSNATHRPGKHRLEERGEQDIPEMPAPAPQPNKRPRRYAMDECQYSPEYSPTSPPQRDFRPREYGVEQDRYGQPYFPFHGYPPTFLEDMRRAYGTPPLDKEYSPTSPDYRQERFNPPRPYYGEGSYPADDRDFDDRRYDDGRRYHDDRRHYDDQRDHGAPKPVLQPVYPQDEPDQGPNDSDRGSSSGSYFDSEYDNDDEREPPRNDGYNGYSPGPPPDHGYAHRNNDEDCGQTPPYQDDIRVDRPFNNTNGPSPFPKQQINGNVQNYFYHFNGTPRKQIFNFHISSPNAAGGLPQGLPGGISFSFGSGNVPQQEARGEGQANSSLVNKQDRPQPRNIEELKDELGRVRATATAEFMELMTKANRQYAEAVGRIAELKQQIGKMEGQDVEGKGEEDRRAGGDR